MQQQYVARSVCGPFILTGVSSQGSQRRWRPRFWGTSYAFCHNIYDSFFKECRRTPQVLSSTRRDRYGTLSTELLTDYHHNTIMKFRVRWCVWKVGEGFPGRFWPCSIKMGSCVFQCDVPHPWIAQRQVSPVSVYCDGVGCHVLCLRHGIPVWQHTGQSTTATSRHCRDMTSDVKATLNLNI